MKLTSGMLRKMINEETQMLRLRRSIRRMISEAETPKEELERMFDSIVDQKILDGKKAEEFKNKHKAAAVKKFEALGGQGKDYKGMAAWVEDHIEAP